MLPLGNSEEDLMDERLDNYIFARFDALFELRHGTPQETVMCYGLDVGTGWFKLIYELCDGISKVDPTTRARQVKEKFGGLRFYYRSADEKYEEVNKLIENAARQSIETCDICGEKGEMIHNGWVATRCKAHRKATSASKIDRDTIVAEMIAWAEKNYPSP